MKQGQHTKAICDKQGTPFHRWAGYIAHVKARTTKAQVVLVRNQDWWGALDYPYSLICDTHDVSIDHENSAEARRWMSHPEMWCKSCQEIHERKSNV